MEICDKDLHKFITESKEPLPMETFYSFAIMTASGLAHLHSLGIIHRYEHSSNPFFLWSVSSPPIS
jgi:serine/threonine protein kinase